MKFTRITVKPDQMGGVPCIRGLHIPVATVIGMIAEGMSQEEIVDAYFTIDLFAARNRPDQSIEGIRRFCQTTTFGENLSIV